MYFPEAWFYLLEALCLYTSCSRNTENHLSVALKVKDLMLIKGDLSLLCFISQSTPSFCNLLCLTALVSQGERGIMGASGHYTVIGCPPYKGRDLDWHMTHHDMGLGRSSQPWRRSPFSVVASLFSWFQPSLSPPKNRIFFYCYLFFLFLRWILFYLNLYLLILFVRALLSWTLAEEIFKK